MMRRVVAIKTKSLPPEQFIFFYHPDELERLRLTLLRFAFDAELPNFTMATALDLFKTALEGVNQNGLNN